jgi:predicted nucleic acid-binding protein
LLSRGDAALCDLTMVELWNGAQGRAEKKALEDLEAALPLYPVNERVWASARALARRCRDSGVTVPTADIVIAACATSNNLALEYCDSHFDRILPLAQ